MGFGSYVLIIIWQLELHFQPSMEVFKDMTHELEIGRENPDGADQGFICGYFPDLLDHPLFHPPNNGTKLNGTYRLPLGYQMDASYYCKSNMKNYYYWFFLISYARYKLILFYLITTLIFIM